MSNYLINTILPLKRLKSIQITDLISYLSPTNAVIYGSSILYAYKNTLVLGNNSNVGDVDIAINDTVLYSDIISFLTTALPDATVYRNDTNQQSNFLNLLYTLDNTVNYVLSQTSVPPNTSSMGTFILENNNAIHGTGVKNYGNNPPIISTFYQNNKLLIQVAYYDTNPNSMKEYIQTIADFSVASGIYDGINIYIPSDIDKNITVYRDPLNIKDIAELPPPINGINDPDWMLYRLKKYIDRGFIIYFDNQTQIDDWTNSLWPDYLNTDVYILNFVCPFNLKPNDYALTWIENPVPPYPCFKLDTKILTNKGYIPIQDLRTGDLVKTVLHNFKPIVMIGKRDIIHPASQDRIKDQLYKCTKSNYPEIIEDLIITGCHCILVDDFINPEQREKTIKVNSRIFVTDKKYRLPACVDDKALVYETPGTYTIYHFALENVNYYMNYGIYANGLLVETCSKRYLKEHSNMTLIE